MTRLERHRQIVELRAAGLSMKEIARYLKLSKSTVYEYYDDPSGEKARARKMKRHGTCRDCGCDTFNSGSVEVPERCRPCQMVYQRTLEFRRKISGPRVFKWSDEEILDALRRVAEDGVVTGPMYDAAYEKAPKGSMPSRPLIVTRFELWSRAVEAAGLRGVYDHSGPYSCRLTREGALCAVVDCGAAVGHVPTYAEYEAWAKETGSPSGTLVRVRFGSWAQLMEACAAELGVAA